MILSVIVPTLNEGNEIEGCLQNIRTEFEGEILVVDAGSSDDTVEKAIPFCNKVLHGPLGIAAQCNFAAERATGDVLFFIGADVRLPRGWLGEIEQALQNPNVMGGGFALNIRSDARFFRVISWWGNLRSKAGGFTNPDQGLFIQRKIYEALGGMKPASRIPFARLCHSLKKVGDFRILNTSVLSSPRKWLEKGRIRTTFRHVRTYLEFLLAEIWWENDD